MTAIVLRAAIRSAISEHAYTFAELAEMFGVPKAAVKSQIRYIASRTLVFAERDREIHYCPRRYRILERVVNVTVTEP